MEARFAGRPPSNGGGEFFPFGCIQAGMEAKTQRAIQGTGGRGGSAFHLFSMVCVGVRTPARACGGAPPPVYWEADGTPRGGRRGAI